MTALQPGGTGRAIAWRRRLFLVSPADDLPVGVAAIDDAHDEHSSDGHVSYDLIYMNGYVNLVVFFSFQHDDPLLPVFVYLCFSISLF